MLRLLKLVKPSFKTAFAIIILVFLQTMGTLYIPTLMAEIVNNGILQKDMAHIVTVGRRMLLVAALTGIIALMAIYLNSRFAADLDRRIRNSLFQKAQTLSVADFNQIGAASMITRTTSDVTQVQQATIMLLSMFLPVPVMIIGGLLLAFHKDTYMALIIGSTILLFAFLAVFMGRKVMPLFIRLQEYMDLINQRLRENITGVRVIRAFNRVRYEQARLTSAFSQYAQTAIKVNKMFAVMMPLVMFVMDSCIVAIIYFGSRRVAGGFMAIGDIMALTEYAMLILFYLIMGVMAFIMLPRAQACAKRIMEVMDMDSLNDQFTCQRPLMSQTNAKISFQHVTFRYQQAEEAVLTDISFELYVGQTLAIIGGTGSGKSTIANLLLRFYEAESGQIFFDGMDIRCMEASKLREKIAYVPQKAFLFSGSIADNLRYGQKEADLAQMKRAAEIAQAAGFIEALPNGYDTLVAQGGDNFSGGQKQRLAIARALVKPADIYVFDDSFSALDYKTDAKLRRALQQFLKDAALLIVAQRINTIIDADKIIVLHEGKIVGLGTHQELLQNCDVYRQIAASQLRKGELA